MTTCEMVCRNENVSVNPSIFLLTFTNGQLLPACFSEMKFSCYEEITVSTSGKKEKFLVVNSKRLQYIACCSRCIDYERNKLGYYICLFNKKTQKMMIYSAHLTYCSPILKKNNVKMIKSDKNVIKPAMAIIKRTALQAITDTPQQCSSQANVNDALETNIQVAQIIPFESSSGTQAKDHYFQVAQVIPPQNSSAKLAKDIYCLNDIIPEDEYKALDNLAKSYMEISPDDIKRLEKTAFYSTFVFHHLENISSVIDIHVAKLFVYYDFIFFLLSRKDFRRKDPIPLLPQPFKDILLDRFSVSEAKPNGIITRSMPQRLKDKAMAYAMILSLFIGNWCLDTSFFIKDFNCSEAKALKIACSIGCHIKSKRKDGVSVKLAELRLPLYKPSNRALSYRKHT